MLANPEAGPRSFTRPGHVFPLRAKPGGVLVRAGQTEASVDLCRMAGLEPVAVVCEIIKDDGTRSEEHTSELQSLMRISYAVFCLKKKKQYILTTKQKKN